MFQTQIPTKPKKQNLRKAFNHLKTHAAAIANFIIQWQDLEDHFLSIHNSILQSLAEKTQLAPTLQSLANFQQTLFTTILLSQAKSQETQLIPTLQSQETQLWCKEDTPTTLVQESDPLRVHHQRQGPWRLRRSRRSHPRHQSCR
jgi:hypothetical protein